MKRETKALLKEKGKASLFTEEHYKLVVDVMKHGMTKDAWLKNYLSLDPYNKAEWISDHIISLVEAGHIK
jgi:hypothetical protein